MKGIVIFLLGWHAVEALIVFPHYLSYFNEFVGGSSNGYRYLRDSNVDWGQDLKGLGKFVKENNYPEVALFFFGPASPDFYGIPYRRLEPSEFKKPIKAVYAIGAHFIDQVEWTKDVKPTKIIGYSVFVYDLRQ